MKVAIITDTHFGARGNSQVFAKHFRAFYQNIFFPKIDELGIKVLLHLGDLNDQRKQINMLTAKNLEEDFIAPLHERGVTTHIIVGNHDTYHKNTNEVNSVRQLYSRSRYNNLHIYDDSPVELDLDGLRIMLAPWVCQSNYDASLQAYSDTTAQVLMGHFEVNGFEMIRGQYCDHGFDRKMFKKFDMVFSGHFHHPSESDNIKYLGAPYEMNWSDYNGKRGFHIFDTDDRSLEFVPNPYRIFHRVTYDDTDVTLEDVENLDLSHLTDAYVKLIVKERTNPQTFDAMVTKLQTSGAFEVKVVEDASQLDTMSDDEILDQTQDTMSIINTYINNVETKVNKKEVLKVVRDLYAEAINL